MSHARRASSRYCFSETLWVRHVRMSSSPGISKSLCDSGLYHVTSRSTSFAWTRNTNKRGRNGKIRLKSAAFATTAFSGAVVTDRAAGPPFSIDGSRLSPHTRTLNCAAVAVQPHVAVVCCLNGLHPRNPCTYMDYYSFTDPEGLEGWVGLVGWLTADSSSRKWSSANYR